MPPPLSGVIDEVIIVPGTVDPGCAHEIAAVVSDRC